jgi:hypothetical protein
MKNTVQRSVATAGFAATAQRKVRPANGRRVMVVTAHGEVLGIALINTKVVVGGKATSGMGRGGGHLFPRTPTKRVRRRMWNTSRRATAHADSPPLPRTDDGLFAGLFVGVADADPRAVETEPCLSHAALEVVRDIGMLGRAARAGYLFYVPRLWISSGDPWPTCPAGCTPKGMGGTGSGWGRGRTAPSAQAPKPPASIFRASSAAAAAAAVDWQTLRLVAWDVRGGRRLRWTPRLRATPRGGGRRRGALAAWRSNAPRGAARSGRGGGTPLRRLEDGRAPFTARRDTPQNVAVSARRAL